MNDVTNVADDSKEAQLYDEAYKNLFDEIRNLPASDVMAINIDIPAAVTTVMGALPKIKAHRDAVASHLPHHDIARFDKIEAYALAVGQAQALYQAASAPAEPLDELVAQAVQSRDLLFSDASALARRNLLDGQKLNDLKGGTGYRNVGFDLLTLVAMMRNNWTAISGNSGVKQAEIDQAAKLGARLIAAVGLREQSPAVVAEAADNRQRAFTLFVTAYDQVRRALSYLQWNEGDVDQIAPSLYAGRNNGRRKSPDAPPVTATPAAPVSPAAPNASTAASPNHNGSPAVAVGLPNRSPFLGG